MKYLLWIANFLVAGIYVAATIIALVLTFPFFAWNMLMKFFNSAHSRN